MKANELLMIGDWVYSAFAEYPCKVEGIELTESGYAFVKVGGVDEYKSIESLSPIPLTPEILEKNGFAIKAKWAQIGNFGDSPLIMWHFVDDPILRDYKTELEVHQNNTGKVHVRIPCEYVHELQHALRLCNIEKTIVL